MNTRTSDSCRELFKHIKILPIYSQYIYSLILYTVNNKHLYTTRCNNNLHLSTVNLSKFNKGAYFSGIKFFNHLLEYINNLTNDRKCFITPFKRFLYQHSFYLIEECSEYKETYLLHGAESFLRS